MQYKIINTKAEFFERIQRLNKLKIFRDDLALHLPRNYILTVKR